MTTAKFTPAIANKNATTITSLPFMRGKATIPAYGRRDDCTGDIMTRPLCGALPDAVRWRHRKIVADRSQMGAHVFSRLLGGAKRRP